jgi:hydrogenase-1 operon protein HyaF
MTGLDRIGVRVETTTSAADPSYVPALLREIEALLTLLVETGRSGRIDLRSLPLLPGDDQRLADALGSGEVDAVIEALGATHVRETGVAGVWWVTHANADGETVAAFIDITLVPEILMTHADDARAGLVQLRSRLNDVAQEGDSHGG